MVQADPEDYACRSSWAVGIAGVVTPPLGGASPSASTGLPTLFASLGQPAGAVEVGQLKAIGNEAKADQCNCEAATEAPAAGRRRTPSRRFFTGMGTRTATKTVRSRESMLTPAFPYASSSLHARLNRLCSCAGGLRQKAATLVQSHHFECVISILVVVSAVLLGVQVHLTAKSPAEEHEAIPVLVAASNVICGAFVLEVSLRLFAHGDAFFTAPGRYWNVFDLAAAALQLTEVVIAAAGLGGSLSAMRLLRMIRCIRLLRICRSVQELRTIVYSIVKTFRMLLWTVVLLASLVYMVSVYFTQVVADSLRDRPDLAGEAPGLARRYGTLARTMQSMSQAISGGISWYELADPLYDHVSAANGLLFYAYIAFSVFAMMNVITGIMVESALQSAKERRDSDMVRCLEEVMKAGPGTAAREDGVMTREQFEQHIRSPAMVSYFNSIDLDISNAAALFDLLDVDKADAIGVEDFIGGCLRLQGPAQAIDLAALNSEVRFLSQQLIALSPA